jgi:hypothetical protein
MEGLDASGACFTALPSRAALTRDEFLEPRIIPEQIEHRIEAGQR